MNLSGRVALVTGGASGIGWGAAKALAKCGMKVALLGRTESELKDAAEKLQESGQEAMTCLADVSNYDEIKAAISQIDERWGRLDVVFANAGINGVWAPLDELSVEEWRKTIDINLTGTFLTIKSALSLLKKRGGSVIITASVNGTRMFSNTGASAYATSKAGQVAFAKMIALELAPDKVRVNVICPGWIESDIDENTAKRDLDAVKIPVEFPEGAVPLTDGEPGTAEQVGNVVAFLASDLSSHVTGTEIWVDGGQSLLQG